jgi:glycosyltransferase involved in cell wall biosynthesis
MNISIITTCKSRLAHLKLVINTWNKFQPHEIIVVDVMSPDGLSEWLNEYHPHVKIQLLNRDGFNVSEARNYGATVATGDYLFFVDADIVISDGLHEWFKRHMLASNYAVRFRENEYDGIHEQGTVLVSKEIFVRVEGFDVVFSGYGGEDHDFYEKLIRAGCIKTQFPKDLISSLEHSDEARTLYYAIKSKQMQSIINRAYRSVKHAILAREPGKFELSLDTREKIWLEINKKLGNDFEAMRGKKLTFSGTTYKWLPPPYYLEEKFLFTLEVKIRETLDNHPKQD